jgi:hypothetical protein
LQPLLTEGRDREGAESGEYVETESKKHIRLRGLSKDKNRQSENQPERKAKVGKKVL